jgi:hypothetical protein
MKKIIRLTESDLTKIVKQIIIETKNSTSKSEILKMSDNELEDLKVKGKYLGKKGEFFNFKKNRFGDVVCGFRTDDETPSGLKKSYRNVKVKSDDVQF